MSCPPMSQMTSTSPKKCTALIMCATVSTMFTSALHALLEHVGGVAGGAEAHHLELGALVASTYVSELREELLRVLDRVALRELVRLAEDARPSRSRRAPPCDDVEPPSMPMTPRTVCPALELRGLELRDACRARGTSSSSCRRSSTSGGPAVSPRRALRPLRHVLARARRARRRRRRRRPRGGRTAPRRRGVVLRVLGDEDQLLDRDVLGIVVAALVPGLRDAQAPALLQERQVGVRAAEQEHAVLAACCRA